jgi:hypothetical protein
MATAQGVGSHFVSSLCLRYVFILIRPDVLPLTERPLDGATRLKTEKSERAVLCRRFDRDDRHSTVSKEPPDVLVIVHIR